MKTKIGHRLLSFILAGAMAFGAAAAVAAEKPSVTAFAADYNPAVKTVWKTGMAAFSQVFPLTKVLDPLFEPLFNSTPAKLEEINKSIKELRQEMNERLDSLEKSVDKSTKIVLNKIKNQTYLNGLGTELDNLHRSVREIADQIESKNKDSSKTPEQRALAIASLIGKSNTWSDTSKPILTIQKIADTLAGDTFTDFDGRDFYQVMFDYAAGDVMFSGEAYDAAKPYVDRVMLEYFYAYTVLKQCLEAAKTVSLFTDEQVAAFNEVDKFEYLNTVSDTVTIDDELEKITDQIFDASSEKSVVSHYTAFKYNAQHDRNVFVNKGTECIPVAEKVRQIRPSYKPERGSGSDFADSVYNKGKNDISSSIAKNAVSSSSMKALYDYYRSRYPGITFIDYLKKTDIDASAFVADHTSFFPVSDKISDVHTFGSYRNDYYAGFTGFDPRAAKTEEKTVNWYHRSMRGMTNQVYFEVYNNSVLVFDKGKRTLAENTAEKILRKMPGADLSVDVHEPYGPVGFPVVFYVGEAERPVESHWEVDFLSASYPVKCKGYVWEAQELPEDGITITEKGMVSFTKSGWFHVRVKATNILDEYVYSNWITLTVYEKGDDSEPSEISETTPYTEADENTRFIINYSYNGLVGAEPDRIERPREAYPPYNGWEESSETYPSHKRFMVCAYDGTGREINVKYTWEAREDKGITLTEDGLVSFSEAGSYQVRVRSGEYVSDWFWVNADTESDEYATVSLLDDDDRVIKNITLRWGEEITPPADPVKDGYTFAGWSQPIPERMPADDIEIYATWTKNAETRSLPDSKPSGKDSNPNTGAAAGLGAAALAAAAVITVMNRRKSR